MSSLVKPSWLLQEATLLDITNHHLFMPASLPTITSLPDEQAFKAGLKQFLFWKGQLLPSTPENTIFLAFLGPEGLKALNVIDITLALKDVCNLTQVLEFYQGANTCFLALSFSAKEPITQIINHFKYFNNSIVLTITHQPPNQHRFRLLWLPPMFNINRVHHLLNGFSHSHRIKRESLALAGTFFTPTNVIAGTLTLEPGKDVNKLPHLIKLPAPHKGCALLSIETRPPFCLKCKDVGHKRPQCPMIKCTLCLKVHFPSAVCGTSSYSTVASRNVTSFSDDDWLAEVTDNLSSNDSSTTLIVTSDPPSHVLSSHSSNNSLTMPDLSPVNYQHSPPSTSTITAQKCDYTSPISSEHTSITIKSDDSSSTPNIITVILPSKTISPDDCNTLINQTDSSIPIITPPRSSQSCVDSPQPASPKHQHKKHPESSKVIITEHPAPSSIARSHFITYSSAPATSTALYSNKPTISDSDPNGSLFGDPNPDLTFFSNSDSDTDTSSKMDISNISTHNLSSRKRKVSHHSDDSPPPVPSTMSIVDEDTLFHSDDALSPAAHSQLFYQVAQMFGADDSQTSILESACPNSTFSPDIIKLLRLLHNQGFTIDNITAFPQILILRPPELRKKIKFLTTHQGTFTIADIWNHNRIEAYAHFIPPPTGPQHP